MTDKVYDYGRSFVTFVTKPPTRHNNARLQVESVCSLSDRGTGFSCEYVFFASCKSEDTFAEKGLFFEDNFDFCGIFSDREVVIFKTYSKHTPRFREREGLWSEKFADVRMHLARAEGRLLRDNAAIVQASLDNIPLIGRVRLEGRAGDLSAVLEFPVKTMNADDQGNRYQVDTGPVPYPDLEMQVKHQVQRFSPAYVAFNAPHFADFVVQQAVPVEASEGQTLSVTHYARPFSVSAQTQVLALAE